MKTPRMLARVRIDSPLKLTSVYLGFSLVWIVGSDALVAWQLEEGIEAWLIDSGKGLLFVAVTSGMLYALIKRFAAHSRATETALRESQLRWQFALEGGAGDGLWDWDVQTNRVHYSRQWKAMLGFAENEIGDALAEWEGRVHPDDLARAKAEIARHWRGETGTYTCEHRLRMKDGTYKWILDRGQVMQRAADGRPLRMLGIHTDISDRKSAEARSSDTLSFARTVLHSSPVGIIAYGPAGQAVMANQAAARIIGTEVTGLLRQNFRELESWRRHGLLAAAERALGEGRSVQHRGPVVTTFGRSIWVRAEFVPFTYKDERHLLFLVNDETENHQAQENLRLMETAVSAAPVGWLVTDPAGTIEWVNPGFTALTGYTPADVVGRNPRMLKTGRHSAEFYAGLWATIRRGEVWSGEMFNQRKDGSQYQEFMTIAPVRDEGGEIRHFVAIKQDITERKALQQQLTRAQRLESIGLLASGIAHDLNNIFAPILLSLELLKLKYPTADARKTLELIESAGQRGAGIVRQVLTFARGMEGERTEVQVRHLVKEAVQILGETLPRNIRIETEVAADLPAVVGDVTQLNQVLLNLAINARDAMPEGGRLVVGARAVHVDEARALRNPPLRPGPCVALTVTDTGTGIPDEVLEHMFEPFYTTKPLGKGTGLGLSTVYGIVRSHGGAIEVATTPGAGSAFTVLLPACVRPDETKDSRPPLPVVFSGAGRRVLVVDDEESIRLVTLHALQRHDFVVELAGDGAEALALFQSDPARFALVVTDLMMPRMNGRDLARAIHRLAPELPIIASSGLTEEAGPRENLALLGIRTLLHKPYTEARLLAVLQQELETATSPASEA